VSYWKGNGNNPPRRPWPRDKSCKPNSLHKLVHVMSQTKRKKSYPTKTETPFRWEHRWTSKKPMGTEVGVPIKGMRYNYKKSIRLCRVGRAEEGKRTLWLAGDRKNEPGDENFYYTAKKDRSMGWWCRGFALGKNRPSLLERRGNPSQR